MIITIIADVLGKENNGTTITIKRLIEGLKDRGHTVRVVSPSESREEGYYQVDKRSFGILTKYIEKNGVELGKPDVKVLREAIKGSDIVHIVLPFKMGKKALKIINEEIDVPFTTAFHCQPENISSHAGLKNFKPVNDFLYTYLKLKFYKDVGYIHCPTQFIANELDKHKYKAKKYVISNGVIPTFKKQKIDKPEEFKDKYVITFIGRFSKEKRHDLLIKAMKYSKYADKIQLVFAGNGPLEHKLKKISAHLPNPPKFGFFTKEELNNVINYTDLYCHPSDIEIEAISCLEAITCGKVPVISDSVRSATNAFALNDKCKFKVGDPKDLANKIDYWIEHENEKKKLEKEYVEYAKQFNIDASITKMIGMFNDAIEEHKQKNIDK